MSEEEVQTITQQQAKLKANETLVRLRLETDALISDIRMYLEGKTLVVGVNKSGELVQKEQQVTEPILNKAGVYHVMERIRKIINPQVVQGNFLTEQYWRVYVSDFRADITIMLMVNAYDWAYNKDIDNFNRHVDGLIDSLCEMIEPFMTRLLFNKERESYADSMQSIESNTVQRKGLSFFK